LESAEEVECLPPTRTLMPKRSNDFQRLIKRIYDELAPLGATVTESALLADTGSTEGSEIDVLVEFPVSGAERPVRMAIECRDHARAGDKTWIDALAGKYRDMPVDRVIAVSRRGFTRGAVRKARQCQIEVRTLADAMEGSWPADLARLEIGEVQHWPEIKELTITAEPSWPSGERAAAFEVAGRILDEKQFGLWLSSEMARLFEKEVARRRAGGSCQFGEPGIYTMATGVSCSQPVILTSQAGTRHVVSEMTLSGSVRVVHEKLQTSRFTFGNVGVTRAPTLLDHGATEVIAVQEGGKPMSIRIVRNTVGKASAGQRRRSRPAKT